MTFWAWEGDASCTAGAGHTGWGCFYYWNNSKNPVVASGQIKVQAPAGSHFTGTTAESILERPATDKPISKFACCPVMEFAAVDTTNTWHNESSDPVHVAQLINYSGQSLVSSFTLGSDDYVGFEWLQGQ